MAAAFDRTIFAQPDTDAACRRFREVAIRLARSLRKAGALLADVEDDVIPHTTLPRHHWRKIWSTNPLERVNKEIKRRTNVVGIFPNREAVTRLVGALMLEQNDEWAVSRRYMPVEKLTGLCDDVEAATMIAAQ